MNIEKWYEGLKIPSFWHAAAMMRFTTSMISAFSIVAGDELNVRPKFYLTDDISTAAIDLAATKIFIGKAIISNDVMARPNRTATESQALGAIFGMVFHESMHFKCTTRNLEAIMATLKIDQKELYLSVNNIMEDFYIDNQFTLTMPEYLWTYEERLNYFFSVKSAIDKFNEFLATPNTANMVGVLIALKNPKARTLLGRLAPEHRMIADAALEVMSEDDSELRPLLAYEVYKMLLEETDASTEEEISDATKGNAENEDPGSVVIEGEGTVEITEESTMMKVSGEWHAGLVEVVPNAQDGLYDSDNDYSKKAEQFVPDDRYYGFARLLKAHSETSTYWTPPTQRGRQIRHIGRIATDGKIFATKIVEQGLGPQEILILVDCSGSMANADNISKALLAASGAAAGLEAGRHNVAVYGHTADHDEFRSFASTVLYRLKGFNEPYAAVVDRVRHFFAHAMSYLSNNDDEMAIAEVSKKFTKQRNNKTLIVISDGAPSSYRSPSAEGTAEVVNEIRAKGINVVSISIDKSANKVNNRIYGADNNFCNEDPNVVIDVIRKIVHF